MNSFAKKGNSIDRQLLVISVVIEALWAECDGVLSFVAELERYTYLMENELVIV